jgi:hypothetical protein
LENQLTAKDTQHRLDIKKIETEKEKIAKAAAEAMAQHEQKMQAHDEHAISAQTYQRVIATKNEEIKRLEGEIVRLQANLEKQNDKIAELRDSRAKALLRNIVPVAFEKQTKDHKELMEKQRMDNEKSISELHKHYDAEFSRRDDASRSSFPPPGRATQTTPEAVQPPPKNGWLSIMLGRKQKAPVNDERAKHLRAHQEIYDQYLKDEVEKYDNANGNQQSRIDPHKRAIRKDAILKEAEARFIALQGRAPASLNLVKNSAFVKTLQHFTFNNNNDDDISSRGSSGEGGLYIARSR